MSAFLKNPARMDGGSNAFYHAGSDLDGVPQ
jgi:hypothetical protein